jgi:hypothetical protein
MVMVGKVRGDVRLMTGMAERCMMDTPGGLDACAETK